MNSVEKKLYDFILSFDKFFLNIISERKKRDLLLTSYALYYIDDKKNLKLLNRENFKEIILSQVDKNAEKLNTLVSFLKEISDDFLAKNNKYSNSMPTDKYIHNINEKIKKIKSLSDESFLGKIILDNDLIVQIIKDLAKVKKYDEFNT